MIRVLTTIYMFILTTIFVFIVVELTYMVGGAIGGAIGSHSNDCHATQPVYAGTTNVGTWSVTLQPGQSVALPDGDRATCTTNADNNGLVIS
jgi:hypothetical protein